MDIISMQIANKVLKRMNTEFNGLYDVFIATGGQTVFRTSKPHDIENKGLHVYVNGFHAVEEEDYVHKNQHDIEFKRGLVKGDIVLLSTQIAGVPKFEVVGDDYDDTELKSEIAKTNERITAIISALDDDGDGTIVDTIANLKKMWDDADGDLVKLIELAATKEELAELSSRVDGLSGSDSYDDTEIKTQISSLENRVKAIEDNSSTDLYINDSKTGRKHKLVLTDGTIEATMIGVPLQITHTAPTQAIINRASEFRLNIVGNADLKQKVKLAVSHNNKITLESNKGSAWEPFVTSTINSLTNLGYSLRATGLEIGIHQIRLDILKFDNNVNLGSAVFSIEIVPAPKSVITGSIELNGANAENVIVTVVNDSSSTSTTANVAETGEFTATVYEAGAHSIKIENNNDTHTVSGESEIPLMVELDNNYSGYTFTLELKEITPTVPEEEE